MFLIDEVVKAIGEAACESGMLVKSRELIADSGSVSVGSFLIVTNGCCMMVTVESED